MATATHELPAPESSSTTPSRNAFLLRRLHSLSGIIPLGAFLIEHFASNAAVLSRHPAHAYGAQVKFLNSLPFVLALEIAFIYIPLLFHGLYGLWIASESTPNARRMPLLGNWAYVWQRISGVIVLAFILWHTWTARFSGISVPDHPELAFAKMQAQMAHGWILAWFLIGITFVCYHFAYGLFLFAAKWGITVTARARQRWGWACLIFGVFLAYAGIASALAFRGILIYPVR